MIPTTIHNGVRGPLFAETAQFLRDRVGMSMPRSPVKLFLSRLLAPQTRPCRNRETIERMALGAGYSVVAPEKLPLTTQFRLIGSASVVVGEYSSAMHSSIFSSAGTVVCCLRGSAYHPGFIQSAIGGALRQPTGYVFGETDRDNPAQGFTVPEDAFRAALSAINEMTPAE